MLCIYTKSAEPAVLHLELIVENSLIMQLTFPHHRVYVEKIPGVEEVIVFHLSW